MLLIATCVPLLAPRFAAPAEASYSSNPASEAILLDATIEKPSFSPIPAALPARLIVAKAGDTADTLAAQFHTQKRALMWANNLSTNALQPGSAVLVPPGPGALVAALPGERPSTFAQRLHLDPRIILDYNSLTSDTPLPAGSYLQVPLGAAPRGALVGQYFVAATAGLPQVPPDPSTADGYPYGQCTYYVASRRNVTWNGNAGAWLRNANGKRPEGNVPVQGAIVVEALGWFGHVAYVEHVNPDGSFLVSEMNYYGADGGGWGRVDHRLVAANDPAIVGFIY